MVGADNGFFRPQTFEQMCDRNPNARYVNISNSGHDLHLEQPDAWRAAVEQFLEDVFPGTAG